MTALTHEDLEILKEPFPASDVKQVKQSWGNVDYIDEEPIANRIEIVDPAWILGEPIVIEESDTQISIKVSVTIKGVTRWGVGTEKRNSNNEPYKSAATDAFKRAARLFGVGRYLLNSGDSTSQSKTTTRKKPPRNVTEIPSKNGKQQTSKSTHPAHKENRRAKVFEHFADAIPDPTERGHYFKDIGVDWNKPSEEIIAFVEMNLKSKKVS